MKISYAIYIFIKLYSKRVITAKQFAQELEISTRTVYRIIDELSLVLPIMSKGGGGSAAFSCRKITKYKETKL